MQWTGESNAFKEKFCYLQKFDAVKPCCEKFIMKRLLPHLTPHSSNVLKLSPDLHTESSTFGKRLARTTHIENVFKLQTNSY